MSRFLIGIDLGTTNSAVAYVDTLSADGAIRIFEVPQLVAPGEVLPRGQLPSFLYMAGEHDLTAQETHVPWASGGRRTVVGELARAQGARVASRMISSAKSWLCHPGVDRNAPILPWGDSDGPKLSPVAASAHILSHIRQAWDWVHRDDADGSFVEQEIVVTVPASFDEAGRELTLAACAQAGFPPVVLLEEPQAAFYAWMNARGRGQERLAPGNAVLVFDVGGGTTDFTLIAVDESGDEFSRIAVGDHLLLGGDNVDLTLATTVERRLLEHSDKKLDTLQWHSLVHACRMAKESLLGDGAVDRAAITVASRGSRLIGGTLRDELTRQEVLHILEEGFFPVVPAGAEPIRGRSGLQEFGLPYAADAAITRHLAAFLGRHAVSAVDCVLFNGGAMTPQRLRSRVLAQLQAWQGRTPRELEVTAPELAVAQGAAYYGLVRRGLATRIRGGTPRAFYVGVERGDGRSAVCVAAKGLEDGARVALELGFSLVTNRPVSFRLYSSSSRGDAPGTVVPVGDGRADTVDDGSDLLELPPIVTVLRARGRSQVEVALEVHITELGALEIHCVDRTPPPDTTAERWKLAFDMRSGGAATVDVGGGSEVHPQIEAAKVLVRDGFSTTSERLAALPRELEALLDCRRDEWSMTTTRALFDTLVDLAGERKRSADHEQRWLHLAGFLLRPGLGAPLDAWRVRLMWGVFNEGLGFAKNEPNRLAWWITWRRIAGGLAAGQQEQIFDRIAALLLPNAKQQKRLADTKASRQEVAEMWRAVASLERLPVPAKLRLGDELMHRLDGRKGREESSHLWALSRLGARVLMVGPLNAVVPASKVREWLRQLLAWEWPDPEKAAFPLAQLGRRTGDRSRDIDEETRAQLIAVLRTFPDGDRVTSLVEEVVALEAREERVALGDTLPAGLRLIADGSEG